MPRFSVCLALCFIAFRNKDLNINWFVGMPCTIFSTVFGTRLSKSLTEALSLCLKNKVYLFRF